MDRDVRFGQMVSGSLWLINYPIGYIIRLEYGHMYSLLCIRGVCVTDHKIGT